MLTAAARGGFRYYDWAAAFSFALGDPPRLNTHTLFPSGWLGKIKYLYIIWCTCYSELQNYSKSTCVLFICSMYLVLLTRIVLVTLRSECTVRAVLCKCYAWLHSRHAGYSSAQWWYLNILVFTIAYVFASKPCDCQTRPIEPLTSGMMVSRCNNDKLDNPLYPMVLQGFAISPYNNSKMFQKYIGFRGCYYHATRRCLHCLF